MTEKFNSETAAEYLTNVHGYKIEAQNLNIRCSKGIGPKSYKMGKFRIFSKDDLDEWADSLLKPDGWRYDKFDLPRDGELVLIRIMFEEPEGISSRLLIAKYDEKLNLFIPHGHPSMNNLNRDFDCWRRGPYAEYQADWGK